jgi:trehalose-6-phosphate synthase
MERTNLSVAHSGFNNNILHPLLYFCIKQENYINEQGKNLPKLNTLYNDRLRAAYKIALCVVLYF